MVRRCVAAVLLAAVAAGAQAQPAPADPANPAPLKLQAPDEGCEPASPGEVVVCRKAPGKYRIDPDVLQVIRRQELAANPPRPPVQVADGDPCKTGPNGCPGEGAVPLLMIALKAAEVALAAAKGEDWREPLRTRPDEYQLYLEERERREKARVSIGVGISDKP